MQFSISVQALAHVTELGIIGVIMAIHTEDITGTDHTGIIDTTGGK